MPCGTVMNFNAEVIKKWLRPLFVIAILATVIFIFVNSCMPPEVSANHSDKVGDIITSVIPEDTSFGKFLIDYLRKIAHFTEYGLLGIEIALYVCVFCKRRLRLAAASLTVPFFVGFIDESIQIASKRGPSISDVWIDIGGFITFTTLTYLTAGALSLAYRFAKRIIKRVRAVD